VPGSRQRQARSSSVKGIHNLQEGRHALAVALHLRGQELSLRDIAAWLVIATGKKKGQRPWSPDHHLPTRACPGHSYL